MRIDSCYKQIVKAAMAELGCAGVDEIANHVSGVARDTAEWLRRHGPPLSAAPVGPAFGDKFFGEGGNVTQITRAAKIAPVTMQTFGVDECYWIALSRMWRDGLVRVTAKPPKYNLGDKHKYYVFVGGGSKTVEVCNFEYTLLRLAADAHLASKTGSGITAAEYVAAGRPYTKGRPLIYREINQRLKYLASQGFLQHEPSIKSGHAGNRRPRWYIATKSLAAEMSRFDLSDDGLFGCRRALDTDTDTDACTDTGACTDACTDADDDFDPDNL